VTHNHTKSQTPLITLYPLGYRWLSCRLFARIADGTDRQTDRHQTDARRLRLDYE